MIEPVPSLHSPWERRTAGGRLGLDHRGEVGGGVDIPVVVPELAIVVQAQALDDIADHPHRAGVVPARGDPLELPEHQWCPSRAVILWRQRRRSPLPRPSGGVRWYSPGLRRFRARALSPIDRLRGEKGPARPTGQDRGCRPQDARIVGEDTAGAKKPTAAPKAPTSITGLSCLPTASSRRAAPTETETCRATGWRDSARRFSPVRRMGHMPGHNRHARRGPTSS